VLIPRKESNAMKRISTIAFDEHGAVGKAWDEVSASFDRFCLAAGIDALGAMMEKDAEEACGARHARSEGLRGHRWGRTQGELGFHAGKVTVERPRVRDLAGQELALPSWDRAVTEDWLGKWAMNLMLINVLTRKWSVVARTRQQARSWANGSAASACMISPPANRSQVA
jgi:putative transposase